MLSGELVTVAAQTAPASADETLDIDDMTDKAEGSSNHPIATALVEPDGFVEALGGADQLG